MFKLRAESRLKRTILSFCLLTAIIVNLSFIFYNSSRTADESDRISKSFAVLLFELKSKLDLSRFLENYGDGERAIAAGGTADEKSISDRNAQNDRWSENPNADNGENGGNEPLSAFDKSAEALFDTPEIIALNSKIRKYSHAAEFLPLGFLFSLLFVLNAGAGKDLCGTVLRRRQIAMLAAVAISVICSVTDEIYQISVDGRTFETSDIFLDSVGGCLGAILAGALFFAVLRFKKGT